MKFLIDECLSPELALLAREKGHTESTHVTWLGRASAKDWQLLPFIVDGDWTFVTRNSYDFRGPASNPGSKGQYTRADIHAGLVCLNGPLNGLDLDQQLELFGVALNEIGPDGDLISQALEITLEEEDGDVSIIQYQLPP